MNILKACKSFLLITSLVMFLAACSGGGSSSSGGGSVSGVSTPSKVSVVNTN